MTRLNAVDTAPYQKNWTPFEYNGELYVEYRIEPRMVFKVTFENDDGTNFGAVDIEPLKTTSSINLFLAQQR